MGSPGNVKGWSPLPFEQLLSAVAKAAKAESEAGASWGFGDLGVQGLGAQGVEVQGFRGSGVQGIGFRFGGGGVWG